MKIQNIKIEDIKPYEKNAKKHTKKQIEQVANSIKEFGFNQPVVVDKDNVLIVGHGRVEGAKVLGMKEVPALMKEGLTDEQIKAYRLADNKLNESDWDMDLVIEELKELDDSMVDLTGFDSDLIIESEERDDEVPEVPEEPTAQLGDIYQLGEHRVMCGDSTKIEDVEKLMDGEKAQMCFTDPPYNVNYGENQSKLWKKKIDKIKNDHLSDDELIEFNEKYCNNIKNFTEGHVYICHAPSEDGRKMAQVFDNIFHWSATIIWVKDRLIPGRAFYQRQYEPIWFGWNSGTGLSEDRKTTDIWEDLSKVNTRYNNGYTTISFQGFKVRVRGEIKEGQVIRKKQRTDIWRHKRRNANNLHPTMKPVAIMEEALKNSSKRENIVVDTFLGSGSTLIACEKTKRICYGLELDPKYIDTIIKRWENYTGEKAIKL